MQTAAFLTGMSMLIAPAASIPIGQTPIQLMTTLAAVEAQEASVQNNDSLACVALFSQPTAKVGQQVILAWGSAGAVPQTKDALNEWPLEGASLMSFSTSGTFTYPFKFYDGSGHVTTCSAKITVTK